MRFEWDAAKAAANLKTRGISFNEAVEVFSDPNAVEGFDAAHSDEENRFYIIGFRVGDCFMSFMPKDWMGM